MTAGGHAVWSTESVRPFIRVRPSIRNFRYQIPSWKRTYISRLSRTTSNLISFVITFSIISRRSSCRREAVSGENSDARISIALHSSPWLSYEPRINYLLLEITYSQSPRFAKYSLCHARYRARIITVAPVLSLIK